MRLICISVNQNQKLTGESDGLRLEFGIEMLRYSCKQLQKRRKLVKIKIDTIF